MLGSPARRPALGPLPLDVEREAVRILQFLRSPVGRKIMMGLTGLFLVLFLVGHLLGNILFFKSSLEFNNYSHGLLKSWFIYPVEIGLLTLFLYHGINGLLLTLHNNKARPQRYAVDATAGHTSRRSVASKTMIYTGVVVFAFLVMHLITMKFGEGFGDSNRNIHRLVEKTFDNPAWVLIYAAFMVLLGFHLWHGVSTVYETFGLGHRTKLRRGLQIAAVTLAGGFFLIPIAILIF